MDCRPRGNAMACARRKTASSFAGRVAPKQHAILTRAATSAPLKNEPAVRRIGAVVNNRSVHLDARERAFFVKDRRLSVSLWKLGTDALLSSRKRFSRHHVSNDVMDYSTVAWQNFRRLHPPVLFKLCGEGNVDVAIGRVRFDCVLFGHRQHVVWPTHFPAWEIPGR